MTANVTMHNINHLEYLFSVELVIRFGCLWCLYVIQLLAVSSYLYTMWFSSDSKTVSHIFCRRIILFNFSVGSDEKHARNSLIPGSRPGTSCGFVMSVKLYLTTVQHKLNNSFQGRMGADAEFSLCIYLMTAQKTAGMFWSLQIMPWSWYAQTLTRM